MNKTLEEIHKIIAEREHGEKKKKSKEEEKKRDISDITDVIVRGGGYELEALLPTLSQSRFHNC